MAASTIAYVLKMYPRLSETFILSELLELERQGARLHVFSLKPPEDSFFHDDVGRLRAPITYVPEAAAASAGAKHDLQARFIAERLDGAGATHVHAHFATAATSVALRIERLTAIPFSFTAHAKDIYLETVRRDSLALKLRSARFAVTVSDFNHRYLASIAPEARLVHIYNGVDLTRFAPNGKVRAQPPLILGVGRLVEKKGFADLVHACALLRREGIRFHCIIVGKGPLESELRRLIGGLGLEAWVSLPGPLPREQLLNLYPRAAVLAAPCVVAGDGNRDGLPTVLVEAMAMGVPVVATPVTGIPELVADGGTGLLVPEHGHAALADAISRILGDPAAASARARAGRARVERDFDLRRNVARLHGLFEETAA